MMTGCRLSDGNAQEDLAEETRMHCHISDIDWLLLTISYLYYIYTNIYIIIYNVQNIDGNEINMDTPQL
jgi:hypothetical protein